MIHRAAEIVLHNGNVLTMAAAQPRAEALAIADGRIRAVGSTSDVRALASPDAVHVDLRGRTVLPGFIDARTPEPDGGKFERDPGSGELTGLLLQRPAFAAVKRLLPVPGPDDKVRAIQHGQRLFSRVGVTSVIDPALTPDAQRAYQQLWVEDALRVRTSMTTILDMNVPLSLTLEDLLARVEGLGPYSGFGDAMLRLGQLKLFVDGFVETAWLSAPYANDANFYGVQAVPRATLETVLRLANRHNSQVGLHCVGDAAVDLALDAFEAADRDKSITDRRRSLMHAVFTSPAAMERARRLGVVISAQQLLLYAFAPTMLTCWCDARLEHVSPHRTWLDRGLVVAAGSDVVPFDPLLGIQSLVTRETLAAGVVGPEERRTRS